MEVSTRSFRILNVWDCLRGKSCRVQFSDGDTSEYLNLWQFLNHLRGRSFTVRLPGNGPPPDLTALRRAVDADPSDVRARMNLGVHLLTIGSPEEASAEYLEAIALISTDQVGGSEPLRRLALRGFARYMAAKALEDADHNAEAREQWQGCVDDLRAAVQAEKYLRENPYYVEAMDKLNRSSTE